MELYADGRATGIKAEFARSLMDRTAGLIPRKSMDDKSCLVIERCGSIHTFFMRFPIDAVFCSEDGRVTSVISRLRPWRFGFDFKASFTVELNAGAALKAGIRKGCEITFK